MESATAVQTEIREVQVTRYITPLREGGSLPAIAEARDGRTIQSSMHIPPLLPRVLLRCVHHFLLPPALPGEGAYAASGTNVAVFGHDHVWIGTTAARVLRSPGT